jgi:hypothetical protein
MVVPDRSNGRRSSSPPPPELSHGDIVPWARRRIRRWTHTRWSRGPFTDSTNTKWSGWPREHGGWILTEGYSAETSGDSAVRNQGDARSTARNWCGAGDQSRVVWPLMSFPEPAGGLWPHRRCRWRSDRRFPAAGLLPLGGGGGVSLMREYRDEGAERQVWRRRRASGRIVWEVMRGFIPRLRPSMQWPERSWRDRMGRSATTSWRRDEMIGRPPALVRRAHGRKRSCARDPHDSEMVRGARPVADRWGPVVDALLRGVGLRGGCFWWAKIGVSSPVRFSLFILFLFFPILSPFYFKFQIWIWILLGVAPLSPMYTFKSHYRNNRFYYIYFLYSFSLT